MQDIKEKKESKQDSLSLDHTIKSIFQEQEENNLGASSLEGFISPPPQIFKVLRFQTLTKWILEKEGFWRSCRLVQTLIL